MKAYVARGYGSPDELQLVDEDTPVPADNEVLVRVRATSVNPYDWHTLRGEPRIMRPMADTMGLRLPKLAILGCDMAGEVEAIGSNVTTFAPGDDVFGLLRGGGFAEYVAVREDLLARKPQSLSYAQAAAVPMAAMTALLALRDRGDLRPAQEVLVNGASGGVGTFAVQIAKALGATVTAVCSARHAEVVRSIGADKVIDYRTQDFTRCGHRYDLLVDIAGNRSPVACRRVLAPTGTWVIVGGPAGRWIQPAGHAFAALALAPLIRQNVVLTDAVSCTQKGPSLETLTRFIDADQVKPVIDRTYPFAELPEAVRYQEEGHAQGKVVITL